MKNTSKILKIRFQTLILVQMFILSDHKQMQKKAVYLSVYAITSRPGPHIMEAGKPTRSFQSLKGLQ